MIWGHLTLHVMSIESFKESKSSAIVYRFVWPALRATIVTYTITTTTFAFNIYLAATLSHYNSSQETQRHNVHGFALHLELERQLERESQPTYPHPFHCLFRHQQRLTANRERKFITLDICSENPYSLTCSPFWCRLFYHH